MLQRAQLPRPIVSRLFQCVRVGTINTVRHSSSRPAGASDARSFRGITRELTAPDLEITPGVSESGHQIEPLTAEQKAKVEKRLTERQRSVLLNKQAEPAYSGVTANGFRFNATLRGTYVCLLGGLPVFHSSTKVDKGFGYATFTAAIDDAHVKEELVMLGMPHAEACPGEAVKKQVLSPVVTRPGMMWVEILDVRAGAHMGYRVVAPDGTQLYCINAAALHFVPEGVDIPTKPWRFTSEADVSSGLPADGATHGDKKAEEKAAWSMKYNQEAKDSRIEFL